MRKEAILELLEEANEIFLKIRNHRKLSKTKVTNILVNLRISLDYAAKDINDNLSVPRTGRFYFPYGETEQKSLDKIKKIFPLLQTENKDLYDEIVKIQPFYCDDDWLLKLCELANHTKHDRPIDVKHHSNVVKSAIINMGPIGFWGLGPNSNIELQDIQIDGRRFDDFRFDGNKVEINRQGDISVNYKITKENKILVGDELLDLIPFLEKCQSNLKKFMDKIYSIIEKNT